MSNKYLEITKIHHPGDGATIHNMVVLLLLFSLFHPLSGIAKNGQIVITEIMTRNVDCFMSPAFNFDSWVELYNPSDKDIPLANYYISNNEENVRMWRCPDSMPVIPAMGYQVIWFDSNEIIENEPPFKLDVDGGVIIISDDTGTSITRMSYPDTYQRTSYALKENGDWGITCMPTPGYRNSNLGFYSDQMDSPMVDLQSQLFKSSLNITVSIPEESKLIYTTDGTTPSEKNGNISSDGFFTITETTNYKFRLYKEGRFPSNVVTRSYIRSDKIYTLPVVSVVTDNRFLYDDSIGVMVEGVNGIPGNGKSTPCNWNMEWNRPVNFTFFADNGEYLFSQDANMKITGAWSRMHQPKSFKIKANKVYGNKTLDYSFFKAKPYIRNKALVFRNGGNDYNCRITDAALETIIQKSGIDMDLQSYQPVLHYLNGEYKGLINMREPNNKHYIYANYGWDEEETDQIEVRGEMLYNHGTPDAFERWYHLAERIDEGTYKEICEIVDIDEYINYQALQLYLGNNDWPYGNSKGFRHRPDGKFRMISFDLDHAFENSDPFNHFEKGIYYGDSGKEVMVVPIFLNMLRNEEFRRKFVDVFCIMGGSVFEPQRSSLIIDSLANKIAPMMLFEDKSPWESANRIKEHIISQNELMMNAIKSYPQMQLSNSTMIKAKIASDTKGSLLFINSTPIPQEFFDGNLFLPVRLKAVPPTDYEFEGWVDGETGHIFSSESEIELSERDYDFIATFKPSTKIGYKSQVVINEISPSNDRYVNDYFKKSDWVELYNPTMEDIDVTDMYLSNNESNPYLYKISATNNINTTIAPHDYLVLWLDGNESKFQLHVPFKLANDDGTLLLSGSDGSLIDKMSYLRMEDDFTVGRLPDGGGSIFMMNVPSIGKGNIYTSDLVAYSDEPSSVHTLNILDDEVISIDDDFIKCLSDNPIEVSVYSMAGICYIKRIIDKYESNEISLSILKPGSYIVNYRSANGHIVCRKYLYR